MRPFYKQSYFDMLYSNQNLIWFQQLLSYPYRADIRGDHWRYHSYDVCLLQYSIANEGKVSMPFIPMLVGVGLQYTTK